MFVFTDFHFKSFCDDSAKCNSQCTRSSVVGTFDILVDNAVTQSHMRFVYTGDRALFNYNLLANHRKLELANYILPKMKFRAVLNQPTAMRDLHGIISMLAKINKETTLMLEPTSLTFVVAENLVQGTPWLWSDIQCGGGGFFSEYTMQGVDQLLHNKIVMSTNTIKLASAVAALSKSQARYVKLKLTNRQFPCLTVELEVPSAAGSASVPFRKVTHDVPVTLIAVRDWSEFAVPRSQQPPDDGDAGDRSIGMPSMRSLRTLVDRIKNLSPSITVYYNNVGELSLVVETDMATVTSHYRNLPVTVLRNGNGSRQVVAAPTATAPGSDGNGEVSCRVSSRQLSMILGGLQMSQTGMWCSIVRDVLMNLRVEISTVVSVNCMFNVVAL